MNKGLIFKIFVLFFLCQINIKGGMAYLNETVRQDLETLLQQRNDALLTAFGLYQEQRLEYLKEHDKGLEKLSTTLQKSTTELTEQLEEIVKGQLVDQGINTKNPDKDIMKRFLTTKTTFETFIQQFDKQLIETQDLYSSFWSDALKKDNGALEEAVQETMDAFDDRIIDIIMQAQKKQEKMRLYGMMCAATTSAIAYKYPASTMITLGLVGTTIASFHAYQYEIGPTMFSLFGFCGYTMFLYFLSRGIDVIGTKYTIKWYLEFKKYCMAFREQQLRSRLRKSFMDE